MTVATLRSFREPESKRAMPTSFTIFIYTRKPRPQMPKINKLLYLTTEESSKFNLSHITVLYGSYDLFTSLVYRTSRMFHFWQKKVRYFFLISRCTFGHPRRSK